MKKTLALLLALVMCLSLVACGGKADSEANAEQNATPQSAIEQLTENERNLFDALVKMATDDFYNPPSVRVLEIGDLNEKVKWGEEYPGLYGPDTVVVRLQADNRAGGTLNHYYRVCIVAAENMDENAQTLVKSYSILGDWERVLDFKGEVGDYVELKDNYSFEKSATDMFNIGNINKALAEYWEDMGF